MLETIVNAIETVINAIGNMYPKSNDIRMIILTALGIWTTWNVHIMAYRIIGFFFTRKFKPTENKHKYAILIAARNEEAVIGNLLDSIDRQDYPKELLTVFVVADNCTDSTAQVARDRGAVCYERFDDEHRTKGFALQFLFENIKKDYGIEAFEGYFIFDSDNLLNSDYVTRMNESFDAGEKIITSYRNTKNFDENWIASTYAIHWLRSIRYRHRARSVLRLATNIQGTGFLFANELVRNGWHYTSLTEDRAFTADAVAHGYPISYNDAAMFYDEQPTSLKVALRQRIRWSKGHLMAFTETGWMLFKNIFVGNCYRDKTKKEPMSWKRFVEGVRLRWASFDTLAQLFPSVVVKLFMWLTVAIFMRACYSYGHGIGGNGLALFGTANYVARFINYLFGTVRITCEPGIMAALMSVVVVFMWNFIGRISYHIFSMMPTAIYVFIVERKRIIKMPFYKKVIFTLTWPVFDAIGRWTTYFALFMKVEWKPIPHTSTVTISEIEKATEELVKK